MTETLVELLEILNKIYEEDGDMDVVIEFDGYNEVEVSTCVDYKGRATTVIFDIGQSLDP